MKEPEARAYVSDRGFGEGEHVFMEEDMPRREHTPRDRIKASVATVVGRITQEDTGTGAMI